jgi:hypothetical protein
LQNTQDRADELEFQLSKINQVGTFTSSQVCCYLSLSFLDTCCPQART